MTTITHEYKVTDKDGFIKQLNTIVKRYKASVEVIWGESFSSKIDIPNSYAVSDTSTFMSGGNTITITIHPVTVNFDFDEFKIEGYSYLGCIKDELMMGLVTIHGNEALEGRDISDFVQSFDSIPCHACNHKHRRKVGHLFLHEETNEVQVFGSSCAKKYFGINFDRLLNFFERINTSFAEGWDDDFIRGAFDKRIDWKSVASLAFYEISKSGYVSGRKAQEQSRMSTGECVREICNGNEELFTKEMKDEYNEMDIPNMDILSTKEYVTKTEGLNDFEHNLLILQESMRANMVTYKNYGWIAFMVWNEFYKEVETPKEAKVEYTIPEWAEKGVRIKKNQMPLDCVVEAVKKGEGAYGVWYLYTFVTGDICLKWFASRDQELEVGQNVTLNGFSVKQTEDNQYGKSVAITRVIVETDDSVQPSPVKRVNPDNKEMKEYFDRMGFSPDNTWRA